VNVMGLAPFNPPRLNAAAIPSVPRADDDDITAKVLTLSLDPLAVLSPPEVIGCPEGPISHMAMQMK
jgi:hypothetical protein